MKQIVSDQERSHLDGRDVSPRRKSALVPRLLF